MTLTYWIVDCIKDAACYSLRAKTRKEVLAMLAEHELFDSYEAKARKVIIEYHDAFDLMMQLTREGGGES